MWRLGHRPELDGLRGVAILLVMLAHLAVPGFASGGHVGVTLFFVLSGFLITSLLREEYVLSGRVDLAGFYRRRALRLLPALVVVVCVFTPADAMRHENVGRNALAALFYVGNWFRASGVTLGDLSHTWSLSIEEQFYLAWPAALILARNRRRLLVPVAAAGAVTAVVLRFVDWHAGSVDRVQFGTDTRMDGLLAGCLLAFVVAARPGVKVSRIAFWAGVAVAAACTVESNTHFAFVLLPGLVAVAGMLLVAGSISSNAGAFLKWRPLRYTGRISYGLYLWHVPLFAHLHEPLPIRVVVGFVAAFALAGLSFRYVEEPLLRRKHRLGRRVSTPAAASLA